MKTFEFKVHITVLGNDVDTARDALHDELALMVANDNHVTGYDLSEDNGEEITDD